MTKPARRKVKKKWMAASLIGGISLAVVPVLIGGRVVDPQDYPAIVRIFSGGASCTAAIVGPNSLLTAAHCVKNGGSVSFTKGGYKYTSEACQHHDGYKKNNTKDFALCKVKDVPGPWAEINTDHDYVKKGDTILLTGYGCIKEGGGGGNDGKLRIGEAKVTKLPSGSSFDIVTKSMIALCYGDSGGPAFKGAFLVGVNSRGNIDDTSYLSATHLADKSYMAKWAEANKAEICGINKKCSEGEKQPEPEAPNEDPKPEPEKEMNWWEKIVWWMLDATWGLIF